MNVTINYFKKREWSMGNGQCPDCFGVPPNWHGHPCHKDPNSIGHRGSCILAECLTELGETPLYQGQFKSDVEFEDYRDENGMFGTRIKLKKGVT